MICCLCCCVLFHSQADVAQAKPQDAKAAAPTAWDAPSDDKPLSEQEPHAKVCQRLLAMATPNLGLGPYHIQ
jgi:hypothetical protein